MRAIGLFFSLLAWAGTAHAQGRDQIVIQGSAGRDYQIALQRFAVEGEGGSLREAFHAELADAINFSGVLAVVDEKAFLGPVETTDFEAPHLACENWRGIGADALVQGILSKVGDRLSVRFRVWDTTRCKLQGEVLRRERVADESALMARVVADDIVGRFTGRRGVSSTQIAFVSDAHGNKEVYVMEATGARRRRVTGNGSINLFPSWSPDGTALVYTSFKGGKADLWTLFRGSRPGARLMKNRDDKYRGVWAPTNGRIAVVMVRDGNTDLYTVDKSGKYVERVTNGRSIETSPSWSPDGSKLAFVSDRSGSPQIYVKDLTQGKTRRITFAGDYNSHPAWSPTGEWLAFSAQTGTNFDLYLIDPESLYTVPLVVHPRSDEGPAWSPDGRKLAFSSSRRGRKEVYRIDLDGRNLVRLTDGFGNSSNPAWSGWVD